MHEYLTDFSSINSIDARIILSRIFVKYSVAILNWHVLLTLRVVKGLVVFPGRKGTIELYTIPKMHGDREHSLRDYYINDRWILSSDYSIIFIVPWFPSTNAQYPCKIYENIFSCYIFFFFFYNRIVPFDLIYNINNQ